MLRYDQGRQDGAHIDQWEDPKYEIYHMQDRSVPVTPGCTLYILHARYGFIHDQRLPDVEGRSAREQKVLEKEMSRVDKWLVMIHERAKWFPDKASNHKKLVDRVWKVS